MLIKKFENFDKNEMSPGKSRIYYSDDFNNLLKLMDSPLAKELLSLDKSITKKDWGFIILDDNQGTIKHTPIKKIINIFKNNPDDYKNMLHRHGATLADGVITKELRYKLNDILRSNTNSQEIRIGRLVKEITGSKNDKEIEEFVNEFKSILSSIEIEVVQGDDIWEWYKEKNYYERLGSLNNSCMKSKSKDIFEIYIKNPNVCKMVILKKDGLLVARSLIWKVDKNDMDLDFQYYVDRQYATKDQYYIFIKKWAIENGYAVKKNNNHNDTDTILWKGQEWEVKMQVKLSEKKFEKFPYCDTFRRFDPENGFLYNYWNTNSIKENGHYLLKDTDGGFDKIVSLVYSSYLEREIPIYDAIWSHDLGTYILSQESVRVYNRGYYPENHPDIMLFDGEYYNKTDFVYSSFYKNDIPIFKSKRSIINLNKLGEVVEWSWVLGDDDRFLRLDYFRRRLNKFLTKKWDNYVMILKDLMVMDSTSEWIPEIISLETYSPKKMPETYSHIFLSKIDAYILGIEIGEHKIIEDWISYTDRLGDLLQSELKSKLESIIKSYKYHIKSGFTLEEFKERLNIIEENRWES